MARNQPFDFSDDDDIAVASSSGSRHEAEFSESGSAGLHGMAGTGDGLMGEAATHEASRKAGAAAREAAEKAAQRASQQTATQARGSAGQSDTPTSMQHKKGNQPR
jgi:hypothetical protein